MQTHWPPTDPMMGVLKLAMLFGALSHGRAAAAAAAHRCPGRCRCRASARACREPVPPARCRAMRRKVLRAAAPLTLDP